MNKIQKSPKFKRIAEKLIQEEATLEYIKDNCVRVAVVESDEEKKKNRKIVFGDCAKVNQRYSWCCPYDFIITVYKVNCELFNFGKKEYTALLHHELLHIGVDNDGNEPAFYVVPHDIEEFYSIIDMYGDNWQIGGIRDAKR